LNNSAEIAQLKLVIMELTKMVEGSQGAIKVLSDAQTEMKRSVESLKSTVATLQTENDEMRRENSSLKDSLTLVEKHQKEMEEKEKANVASTIFEDEDVMDFTTAAPRALPSTTPPLVSGDSQGSDVDIVAPPVGVHPFESQLAILESAGHSIRAFNIALLELHKGDLEKVFTDLRQFNQVKPQQ